MGTACGVFKARKRGVQNPVSAMFMLTGMGRSAPLAIFFKQSKEGAMAIPCSSGTGYNMLSPVICVLGRVERLHKQTHTQEARRGARRQMPRPRLSYSYPHNKTHTNIRVFPRFATNFPIFHESAPLGVRLRQQTEHTQAPARPPARPTACGAKYIPGPRPLFKNTLPRILVVVS